MRERNIHMYNPLCSDCKARVFPVRTSTLQIHAKNGMAFVNRVADLRLDLLLFKGNWFAFVNSRQKVETQISHSTHKLFKNFNCVCQSSG